MFQNYKTIKVNCLDKNGFKELKKFSFENPEAIGDEYNRLKNLYSNEEQIFVKLLEVVQILNE